MIVYMPVCYCRQSICHNALSASVFPYGITTWGIGNYFNIVSAISEVL